MNKKQELIEKFERNKSLISKFKKIYEEYVNRTNTWESPAFFDSNMTNRIYFDEFVRVTNLEYSDTQTESLKLLELEDEKFTQYISGVNIQFENLSKLYDDLIGKFN